MATVLQTIAAMDEAYLTALSNKGTYKRALKELEGTEITLTIANDKIRAAFPDGIVVEIPANIRNYNCSCPSREVCRHLIMAILTAQRSAPASNEPSKEIAPPNYDFLLKETARSIEKKTGKKLFKKAVFQLEIGAEAKTEESTTLTIALNSGYTVYFLPDTSVEAAKCTCKSTNLCEHRAEAVFHYIKYKTGSFPDGLFDKEQTISDSMDTDIIPFMLDFAHRFFNAGLVRASVEYRRQFEHLGVLCHSRRLANHERLCNRIAGQLEHMENRSASFSIKALLSSLCTFINLCHEVEAGHTGADTVGVFRDEYFMIPDVTLHGLGADAWESIGGYRGVTTYFYCEERKAVVTYTAALPVERAPDIATMYDSELWGLPLSIASKKTIKLHNGKLSQQNQLSASSESIADKADTIDSTTAPLEVSDFSTLPDIVWNTEKRAAEIILTNFCYGKAVFNEVEQTLYVPVTDSAGRTLTLSARYKDFDKRLIENMQFFAATPRDPQEKLFVKLYMDSGKMKAYPISVHGNDIFNLSLDRLDMPGANKTNKYYNW